MRHSLRRLTFCVLLGALAGPPALAQDAEHPPMEVIQALGQAHRDAGSTSNHPIPEEHQTLIEGTVQLGEMLHRRERASRRARAFLEGHGVYHEDARIRGWLTFSGDGLMRVLVVGEEDGEVGALYLVIVPDEGEPELHSLDNTVEVVKLEEVEPPGKMEPMDAGLEELWTSRQAALAADWPRHGATTFHPEMIIMDSTAERWVYMVAGSSDPDEIVLAGHSVVVVEEGGKVARVTPHSGSRHVLQTGAREDGLQLTAGYVHHPYAPAPRETHVFTSLRYELPLYVSTPGHLWFVHGTDIQYLGSTEGNVGPTKQKKGRKGKKAK